MPIDSSSCQGSSPKTLQEYINDIEEIYERGKALWDSYPEKPLGIEYPELPVHLVLSKAIMGDKFDGCLIEVANKAYFGVKRKLSDIIKDRCDLGGYYCSDRVLFREKGRCNCVGINIHNIIDQEMSFDDIVSEHSLKDVEFAKLGTNGSSVVTLNFIKTKLSGYYFYKVIDNDCECLMEIVRARGFPPPGVDPKEESEEEGWIIGSQRGIVNPALCSATALRALLYSSDAHNVRSWINNVKTYNKTKCISEEYLIFLDEEGWEGSYFQFSGSIVFFDNIEITDYPRQEDLGFFWEIINCLYYGFACQSCDSDNLCRPLVSWNEISQKTSVGMCPYVYKLLDFDFLTKSPALCVCNVIELMKKELDARQNIGLGECGYCKCQDGCFKSEEGDCDNPNGSSVSDVLCTAGILNNMAYKIIEIEDDEFVLKTKSWSVVADFEVQTCCHNQVCVDTKIYTGAMNLMPSTIKTVLGKSVNISGNILSIGNLCE